MKALTRRANVERAGKSISALGRYIRKLEISSQNKLTLPTSTATKVTLMQYIFDLDNPGQFIDETLNRLGITSNALARISQIDAPMLRKIRLNESSPTLRTLKKLFDAINVESITLTINTKDNNK